MDCLDRTNVVQSTLSRWILNRQLREVGILQSTEVIENDEQFMQIFRNSKCLSLLKKHLQTLTIFFSVG